MMEDNINPLIELMAKDREEQELYELLRSQDKDGSW